MQVSAIVAIINVKAANLGRVAAWRVSGSTESRARPTRFDSRPKSIHFQTALPNGRWPADRMINPLYRFDIKFFWVFPLLCSSGVVLVPGEKLGSVVAQTIYVKVLVDEEEPRNAEAWKRRLGLRVQKASDVISRYCALRFVASSYATWDSDDGVHDFGRSLGEFEHEVQPSPAHIAVGFTSQYRFREGRNRAGGTRGPLHSHILIREGSRPIHEMERVEVLVHELGHFLGAAHSASPESAMRPTLGDGLARSKHFRIQFDRDNARVIRLVAAEIRDSRIRQFERLSEPTKRKIRAHYVNLVRQAPNDPTARRYIDRIDRTLNKGARLSPFTPPRHGGSKLPRDPAPNLRINVQQRGITQEKDRRATGANPSVGLPKVGDPRR